MMMDDDQFDKTTKCFGQDQNTHFSPEELEGWRRGVLLCFPFCSEFAASPRHLGTQHGTDARGCIQNGTFEKCADISTHEKCLYENK